MSDLFRLSGATRHDPAVEKWFAAQRPELRSIAFDWFSQMRRCGTDVLELMHDGCPVACVGDVAFAYVNAFTSHVNVGFFRGSSLDDPAGLLAGTGKRMRHIKLRPEKHADTAAICRLIEDAYADIRKCVGQPPMAS